MATYSFENVKCEKCGRVYAVPKGTAKDFRCPDKRCRETANPKEAVNETVRR